MQDFYVNYNITINQFWNISDCEQRCTSNIFCMTFTYDHTTKRCWKYLHMRAEELFNIVPVAANVTTSVKEGYAGTYIIFLKPNVKLGLVVRKPDFCICENKDADHLRGDREADQRLCFRHTDRTVPLLSKSEISSL